MQLIASSVGRRCQLSSYQSCRLQAALETSKSAIWAGASGRSLDWGSPTALSSSGANKNASTFSIGRGKYFKIACSNDLQISSTLSAEGKDFVVTTLPHPSGGGDDAEGNGPPPKRKRTHSRLLMGRRNHVIAVSLMADSN